MLKSLASFVSLRVLLLVSLSLGHFVRKLGWNLNVVINEQLNRVRGCVHETLHGDDAHWINIQELRWTGWRWTDQGKRCVPRELGGASPLWSDLCVGFRIELSLG